MAADAARTHAAWREASLLGLYGLCQNLIAARKHSCGFFAPTLSPAMLLYVVLLFEAEVLTTLGASAHCMMRLDPSMHAQRQSKMKQSLHGCAPGHPTREQPLRAATIYSRT